MANLTVCSNAGAIGSLRICGEKPRGAQFPKLRRYSCGRRICRAHAVNVEQAFYPTASTSSSCWQSLLFASHLPHSSGNLLET